MSNLLAGNTTDSTTRHTVHIDEGKIDQGEAAKLLKGFEGMGRKLRNASKKWAKNFREKINSYVYRSGTGRDPQTWPLIRKVVLFGPWNVLSTGACLVDLPGVRDANAARAKVAEKYLQQCHRLWIVAPVRDILSLFNHPSVRLLTPSVVSLTFSCIFVHSRSSAPSTMGQVSETCICGYEVFIWLVFTSLIFRAALCTIVISLYSQGAIGSTIQTKVAYGWPVQQYFFHLLAD